MTPAGSAGTAIADDLLLALEGLDGMHGNGAEIAGCEVCGEDVLGDEELLEVLDFRALFGAGEILGDGASGREGDGDGARGGGGGGLGLSGGLGSHLLDGSQGLRTHMTPAGRAGTALADDAFFALELLDRLHGEGAEISRLKTPGEDAH